MAFSLKHIPEWNALEIKQNGKNSRNVYNRFQDYLARLRVAHQADNWTWYIPDSEFDNWMEMFSEITTMTQTVASIKGNEQPIVPEINYRLKHKDKMKLPPYPFQEVGANFLVEKERGIIGDEMGLGKAQPLDAQIATPYGWLEMGDIEVGDEVFGVDGKPQKVISVYPQGKKPTYEIEFDDGSVTQTTDEHLWTVQNFNDRYKHDGRWRTLTLEEIKEDLEGKSERYKLFIPMTEPVEYDEQDYLIHPYLMGYLLGDGSFVDDYSIELTIEDEEMKDIIVNYLKKDAELVPYEDSKYKYRLKETNEEESVFQAIQVYGLHKVDATDTFIPESYLHGSYEQRLSLLQGIMDADGHSPGSKVAEYATMSEQLQGDVVELIQSLGGRATTFQSEIELADGSIKTLYRLTVNVPSGMEVFQLPRKLKEQPLHRKYQYNRSFKRIKYIGMKEAQCIKVENKDGLYLTDDYIVTHNTMSALTAYNELYHEEKTRKALLIVPASLKYQWEEEVRKFTDFIAIVIDGPKKKRREQYEAFETGLDNFLIISYETMRNDIDIVKDLPFEMVVCDEAHRLKNRQTKLYKAAEQLDSDYLFLLTGTPMQNKLDELYALFRLIDKDILGGVTKFKKKHYVVGEKFGRRYMELGYKHLDEVRERTAPYLIRRTKKEVAPDLPERIYSKVYVDMYGPQAELYKEVEDSFKLLQEEINEFYESQSEADARAGKKAKNEDMVLGYMYMMQAISNHPLQLAKSNSKMARAYTPFIAKARNSAKLDELIEILGPLMEEKDKVVIFSQYVSMLEIIYNHIFTHFGFYPYVIHGGVKSEDRNRFVNEFSKDPMRNVMLLSDAGNYGLVI